MKKFNITGTCIPERHYMVDISGKIDKISKLVEDDEYFTINRSRQYGKTTTLAALYRRIKGDYTVIRMSFEGLSEVSFSSNAAFVKMFNQQISQFCRQVGYPDRFAEFWGDVSFFDKSLDTDPFEYLSRKITEFCKECTTGVVLMIDEVDKSSNNQIFLNFLGMLRSKYLAQREGFDNTFKSVILASVYDIKNLKLKIRAHEEHRYNSPWNIAADFNVDMSFSESEIATMLYDYESEHHTGMDIDVISRELHFYTNGYPYLVSRLCKWIDEEGDRRWTAEGVRESEKQLLKSRNTLFDDLIKNVENNIELRKLINAILCEGYEQVFSLSDPTIETGVMLGILAEREHKAVVSNVIFETYLYDYFVSVNSRMRNVVSESRDVFIKDGILDMPLILMKFQELMRSEYRPENDRFIEEQGRLLFLCFLKPIINGTGHYYVEPETRDNTRMDIVVSYGKEEYIIELKIWRGESYHRKGIAQLEDYMESRHADTGYLLSFSFLKDKRYKAEWLLPEESGKRIFEAVV